MSTQLVQAADLINPASRGALPGTAWPPATVAAQLGLAVQVSRYLRLSLSQTTSPAIRSAPLAQLTPRVDEIKPDSNTRFVRPSFDEANIRMLREAATVNLSNYPDTMLFTELREQRSHMADEIGSLETALQAV